MLNYGVKYNQIFNYKKSQFRNFIVKEKFSMPLFIKNICKKANLMCQFLLTDLIKYVLTLKT